MEAVRLTDEKFNEIYSNENFRNSVAFAHGYCNAGGELINRQTCSYPVRYIVTDAQIEKAKKELKRAKQETFEKHFNDLLFVGMGMEYPARYEDDVCNHRIRTEFLNKDGKQFFVEFGTGRGEEMRVDYSVDRDLEKIRKSEKSQRQDYYNYKNLEKMQPIKYTKTNILNLVNNVFICDFKKIVVDNYTVSCNDKEIICVSPK